MKATALVLTALFGGLQTFAYTDCCCAVRCERDSNSGCGKCDVAAHEEKSADCCDKSGEARDASPEPGGESCVHVEPSADVLLQHADFCPTPSVTLAVLFEDGFTRSFEPRNELSARDGAPPPRGEPLYLLNSVLLI